MRIPIVLLMATGVLLGCGSARTTAPTKRSATVVATDKKASTNKSEKASEKSAKASAKSPRKLTGVPPGHFPPSGQCRLWFAGRAPGKQPKSTDCAKLKGKVPNDAFVLYNGKEWDAQYDWSRAKRGSIPEPVRVILLAVKH